MRTRPLIAALLVVLALAGCAAPAPVPNDERLTALPTDAELLFVARAGAGDLAVEDDSATLTLDDLATVSWFTDRPARQAGMATLTDALAALGWDESSGAFGDSPPNAELTANELGETSVAVELTHATVDGGRVTFEVTALTGAPLASATLSALELFIDSGTAPLVYRMTLGQGLTALITVEGTTVTVVFQRLNEVLATVTVTPDPPIVNFNGAFVHGTLEYRTDGATTALYGNFDYEVEKPLDEHFEGLMYEWRTPEG